MESRKAMLVLALMSLLAVRLVAGPSADCGHNAALGYWMAMAQMDNADAPAELAAKLEQTARGAAGWTMCSRRRRREPRCHRDDAPRLSPALLRLGIEYSRNAEAPIAHSPGPGPSPG